MADLDHPSPGLLGRLTSLGVRLYASVDGVRDVAVRFDDAKVVCPSVSGVGAQMLAAPNRWALALDHDGVRHFMDTLAIIDVGSGHDERQRDATAVYQQMALVSFFFPDPSGSGRQLLAPTGPSSRHHRCFAIARRYPPSRRTPPAPPSIAPRRTQLSPIRESACESHWNYRSVLWARLSTGSPCAARTRSPRTPAAPAWADAQLRACVHTSSWLPPRAAESAAPRAARRHQSLPMNRLGSPRPCSHAACCAASERQFALFTDTL